MRFPFITSLLSAAIAATSLCAAPDGDISDLKPINDWKKLANGVYVASLGETDKLYRYSDLAGAPPKLKALNSLPDVPLTKALKNARYRINPDHKIMVYIPTEPDEKITTAKTVVQLMLQCLFLSPARATEYSSIPQPI